MGLLAILFWVLLVLLAVGGTYYWRAQPFLPGIGVVLVLIFLLGLRVFPVVL